MLTGDLVRPRLRRQGSVLHIDLLDVKHAHWQKAASDLIALLQAHAGQRYGDWARAVEAYEGERVDYIVLRGLAKVLADGATFTPAVSARPPAEIRERLFAYGPVFARPDLFNTATREGSLGVAAKELDLPPGEIEASLFADRPEQYILTDTGPAWTAEE